MTNVDPELEAHQVLPEPSSRPRFTPPDPKHPAWAGCR